MLVDLDWAGAGNQWEQIPPGDRENVPGYSMFLRCSGRFDEAIAWSRKALAAEPMARERILNLGTSLAWGRRYPEADIRSWSICWNTTPMIIGAGTRWPSAWKEPGGTSRPLPCSPSP